MSLFEALQHTVDQMGDPLDIDDLIISLEERRAPEFINNLVEGIEININDLDPVNDHGGLLGYQGAQVLLYLKDQERHFEQLVSGRYNLPKYHVANCQTLKDMRNRNQFERYVVTNDKSGMFCLTGPAGRTLDAELSVCKNCLKQLNYRGYKTNSAAQSDIFSTFNLNAFFAIYSSLFNVLPSSGLSDSYDTARMIDSNQQGLAQCTSCHIWLPASSSNLGWNTSGAQSARVVCLDCQRKLNIKTPHPVPRATMTEIAAARRKSRPLSDPMTWREVYQYADSAYAGLLRMYHKQEWPVPEPGVDILDASGAVCLQIGLAWFADNGQAGDAVVLDEEQSAIARQYGWDAMTLHEALIEAQQDAYT